MIAEGVLVGSVLEVGSRNHQRSAEGNAESVCRQAGLRWEGADLVAGAGVDHVLDILDDRAVARLGRRWDSVLLLNLLEHVYDPIAALRNAVGLVAPHGAVVVSGPAIWELHDYPADFWRPMPGFFAEFARREGLQIVPGSPTWIVEGRLVALDALRDAEQWLAPSTRHVRALYGRPRAAAAALLQRAQRRLGGPQPVFPFTSFAVALRRPAREAVSPPAS
jgi:hypothetical protein